MLGAVSPVSSESVLLVDCTCEQPLPPKEEQTIISDYLDESTTKLNKVIDNKKRQIELIAEIKFLEVFSKISYGINNKHFRDSNLEWIKSIPSDWKVRQLKRLYDITLGRMVQPQPKDKKSIFYPYLKAKNMSWNGLKLDEIKSMWINFNELDSMKLQSGDLLVSEGGEVGKSSFFNGEIENCYFQNSLHRVRENEENNNLRYLYYCLFYCFSIGEIDRVSSSVSISHFTYQKIQRFKIPIPFVEEQKKIANELDIFFINTKKEIDLLNNQISKLEEYKKIIINDVVTGKMKVAA